VINGDRRIEWFRSPTWQKIIYQRDLLRELVSRDIKLRYRRSVLGVAWSLVNPLAQLLVFYFVFSRILPLNIPNYALFLFIGLIVWNWFQSSLIAGTGAIVENRELIKRPGFPTGILPVVTVTTNFVHFVLALPIVLIFMALNQIHVTSAIVILPILFAFQFLLTLSLVYILASVHVTFRDTQYLLGILLLLGFYLSPIIYDSSAVPVEFQDIYRLNPMVFLIESYRSVLMVGELPDAKGILIVGTLSIILISVGFWVFKRSRQRFVEEI
jgi:lipopolysaccharide transport system permease protein